tara:strand:+ start:686 stop:1594 length:909 start_codon:yes stop_codon:yes gene_type:complete
MTVKIYDDGSSYAWTPEMGEDGIIIRISKSTAGSLGWCAQQMWLQQNYPKPQGLVKHLVLGDDVHNGLDLFYQSIEGSGAFHKMVKSGVDMTSYLKKYIPNEKEILSNRRAENKSFPFYEDDYYYNMNWLMEFENARMSLNPDNPLPLANEVRIDVKIDVDIEGHGTIPVQFVGIIDRVFEAPGGGMMLFELKTGKWAANKAADMRKEMAYYKFLIDNADPEYLKERGINRPVTHWGWRFSAADYWASEKVKTISERAMMKRVKDLIKMYLDNHFPPTKDDFKCSYCDLIELCPKYAIQVSE